MDALVRTYEGDDLVISRKEFEGLGLKPGDQVVIRLEAKLIARQLPPDELARRLKILNELAGSWTAENEDDFRRNRAAMWATWQPRNWL